MQSFLKNTNWICPVKSHVFWKTSAATQFPDWLPKLNLGVGSSSKSSNPSPDSSNNSCLVQLHEVIRKKPFTFNTLERDSTYCFLFSIALSGLRLMASKVPLSIQIWNPDNFVEGFKKSSTYIKNQCLCETIYTQSLLNLSNNL